MEKLCKLRDVYRSIAEFETRFSAEYDLSLNEGMLLCSLGKRERLSSGELAELLGLTNSNASKIIRSVENKGLIERVLGEEDKRQMYFSLTSAGQAKLEAILCHKLEMPAVLKQVMD